MKPPLFLSRFRGYRDPIPAVSTIFTSRAGPLFQLQCRHFPDEENPLKNLNIFSA